MMKSPSLLQQGRNRAAEAALRRLASLPFQLRRRGLRLFFDAMAAPLVGRPAPALVSACAATLAFTRRESERFLYRSLLYDALFQMEWLALAYRSKAGLVADARFIESDAHDELTWVAEQPGALIGTMHFGPYSLGLVWLLHRFFQGRRIVVVKSVTNDVEEQRAISRLNELGTEVEFIAPDRAQDFHQLVKKIRGGAVGIIMVDLPPAYGRSSSVELLGHRAGFATGVVDLAMLCGVPLMLFRVCSTITTDRVEVSDILDVARTAAARERAVDRIGRFIGSSLLDHPDHWHMWSRFGEYAVPLEPSAA